MAPRGMNGLDLSQSRLWLITEGEQIFFSFGETQHRPRQRLSRADLMFARCKWATHARTGLAGPQAQGCEFRRGSLPRANTAEINNE